MLRPRGAGVRSLWIQLSSILFLIKRGFRNHLNRCGVIDGNDDPLGCQCCSGWM
jgi:hypothetical protein